MKTSLPRLLLLAVLLAWLPAFAGELRVHFFDVGQGDAALIIGPTGKTVLVDGGPPDAARALASRVAGLVKGPLDLVVLTHPHLDHLGGLTRVIGEVGAKRVLDPGFDHPTRSYAELLEFLAGRAQVLTPDRNPESPEAPLKIGLGEGTALTVLWPRRPVEPFLTNTRSDANSNSIVFRLDHGDVSFLFTGDAEADTEERLTREPLAHGISVLKVPHHGGRHSSTERFLRVVKPSHAVISCGRGNDYGHPTSETLERLTDVGATVWRTDLHGEVLATSDGKTVSFALDGPARERRQPGEPHARSDSLRPAGAVPATGLEDGGTTFQLQERSRGGYLASRRSKVFHLAECGNAQKILKKNLLSFERREEAARTRSPAKDCHP